MASDVTAVSCGRPQGREEHPGEDGKCQWRSQWARTGHKQGAVQRGGRREGQGMKQRLSRAVRVSPDPPVGDHPGPRCKLVCFRPTPGSLSTGPF